MPKGRVIGGGSDAEPESGGRRRGMLPPMGTGPIEVTREYLGQDGGNAVADDRTSGSSGAVLPHPGASGDAEGPSGLPALPSEDAPPAEIATATSKVIYGAVLRYESGQKKLTGQLFREAGPAIRLAHKTKAFKEIKDTATGKPYRSFRKFASDLGLSKSHAYRMLNEVPVTEALASVYTGALPSGHVDFLAAVLRQHGEETLRELWVTAARGAQAARDDKIPTMRDLATAQQVLNLTIEPEDSEPPSVADPAKKLRDVQRAARVLSDPDALRVAMDYDPHAVRQLVRLVYGAAADLGFSIPAPEEVPPTEAPESVPTWDTSEETDGQEP